MKVVNNRPTITIVGHVCIDHNTIDGVFHETWGSAVIYIAEYLKKTHSIDASILASYGRDLEEFTDTTSFILQPTLDRTLVYENTITNGRRRQAVKNTRNTAIDTIDERTRDILSKTDILIFAPLLPNYDKSYIESLCVLLPTHAYKAILPQGYYRSVGRNGEIKKRKFSEAGILRMMNLLIQSDEDSDDAIASVQAWVRKYPDLTGVVTHNSDGVSVLGKGMPQRIATEPVAVKNIVNSVGAGDVFSAELLLSIYEGNSLLDAVVKAQSAARRHITGDTS